MLPWCFINHSQRFCDYPEFVPRYWYYSFQAVTHIIISVAFVVNVTTDLDWQRSSPDLPFGFEHVIVLTWVGTAIARAMVFLAERLSAECQAMLSGGQFPQLEEDCSTQGSIKFAKANAQNS